jgi:hypothetical protein
MIYTFVSLPLQVIASTLFMTVLLFLPGAILWLLFLGLMTCVSTQKLHLVLGKFSKP